MNRDALEAVFDLTLAPLQEIANDRTVMDCAAGNVRFYFLSLSARIADHSEHTVLKEISSKSCPLFEVPATGLGQDSRNRYEPRNYAHSVQMRWENKRTQDTQIAHYFDQIEIGIDRKVFTGLYQVNPADLYEPDLLHNIYLGL